MTMEWVERIFEPYHCHVIEVDPDLDDNQILIIYLDSTQYTQVKSSVRTFSTNSHTLFFVLFLLVVCSILCVVLYLTSVP